MTFEQPIIGKAWFLQPVRPIKQLGLERPLSKKDQNGATKQIKHQKKQVQFICNKRKGLNFETKKSCARCHTEIFKTSSNPKPSVSGAFQKARPIFGRPSLFQGNLLMKRGWEEPRCTRPPTKLKASIPIPWSFNVVFGFP